MKTRAILHYLLVGLNLLNLSINAQHDYAKALHLSTRFLGAQRSGNTQSWITPEGSGGAFTNDGIVVNKDLSGGWHDCGDYIKFHVTGPYTALLYLYGYDKFPEVYPDNYSAAYSKAPGNGIPDVLDEVKIETDYLLKCLHGDTVYWQVGDGRDHNGFNEPISASNLLLYNGTNKRAVYFATEGHSNAMGAAAAALALMGIVYQDYDASYAQQCIEAAKKYYTIGRKNSATTGDARIEDNFYGFMREQYSKYFDEMGMGAVLLYRATNENNYLVQAEEYGQLADKWTSFTYSSIDHLLFYELYELTQKTTYLNPLVWRVNNYAVNDCGYYHNTSWGSLRDAGNAALLAALLHRLNGNTVAYNFAKRNIDFILGSHNGISTDAPKNFSFLIGYNEMGGGYPKRPHHAAAFGKSSNAWTHFTNEKNNPGTVPYAYELLGGLSGGPQASCSTFEDNIGNYISSEYCIYYNAAFNSALAYIHKIENEIVTHTQSKLENPHLIQAFPNPTTDNLMVKVAGTTQLVLLDLNGKIVWNESVYLQTNISTNHLAKGIYLLKDLQSNWSAKIVVQ
jgi:endoglucanase